MSKRAEEAALKAYPEDWEAGYFDDPDEETDDNEEAREYFQQGYEQAEKDIIALVKQYIEKGERCMEQEGDSQIYAFWSGFHNCAENILRELEEEE